MGVIEIAGDASSCLFPDEPEGEVVIGLPENRYQPEQNGDDR